MESKVAKDLTFNLHFFSFFLFTFSYCILCIFLGCVFCLVAYSPLQKFYFSFCCKKYLINLPPPRPADRMAGFAGHRWEVCDGPGANWPRQASRRPPSTHPTARHRSPTPNPLSHSVGQGLLHHAAGAGRYALSLPGMSSPSSTATPCGPPCRQPLLRRCRGSGPPSRRSTSTAPCGAGLC